MASIRPKNPAPQQLYIIRGDFGEKVELRQDKKSVKSLFMCRLPQLVVVVQCARVKYEISIASPGTEVDLVMIRGLKSVTLCLSQLCKHACGTQLGYFNNTMEQCLARVSTNPHLYLPEAAEDTQAADIPGVRQV